MNNKNSREIWATIGLGAVSVFLLARLVVNSVSVSAKSQAPDLPLRSSQHPAPAHTKGAKQGESAFPQTLVLRLDLLQQGQADPLLAMGRDPFQFAPSPEQARQAMAQKAMAAGGQNSAPQAPAAPAIPFKALGYSENQHGRFEAYLADDKDIYAVHEGEKFGNRFRVLKITPNLVEVQDESFNQKSQLLFPQ